MILKALSTSVSAACRGVIAATWLCVFLAEDVAAETNRREIVEARALLPGSLVTAGEMHAIYNEVKTPYKYGVIMRPSQGPRDLQIVKTGELWIMFYLGLHWRPGTLDHCACSRDLVHWTQWQGEPLLKSSEPWDKTFAHKPWILKHDGVVCHICCAVGNQGRAIVLATSQDLRGP